MKVIIEFKNAIVDPGDLNKSIDVLTLDGISECNNAHILHDKFVVIESEKQVNYFNADNVLHIQIQK